MYAFLIVFVMKSNIQQSDTLRMLLLLYFIGAALFQQVYFVSITYASNLIIWSKGNNTLPWRASLSLSLFRRRRKVIDQLLPLPYVYNKKFTRDQYSTDLRFHIRRFIFLVKEICRPQIMQIAVLICMVFKRAFAVWKICMCSGIYSVCFLALRIYYTVIFRRPLSPSSFYVGQ